MRFLVTGGAGFLGINLIRYLTNEHHQVTSLDLSPFSYSDIKSKVQIIQGDIRNRSIVDQAIRSTGTEILIHCAAALPLYPAEDIYSTDVEGTRNILTAALAQRVQRVIHISSTAVYGIPDHHPLYENDRLQGVGAYGKAKIQAEEICREFRNRGLCVPILRPKTFIGPERLGVFALLYDWAYSGRNFPILGSGHNRYQLLHVRDLCTAIYQAATLARSNINDTFNVGAARFTTLKQDFQAVLDYAGHGKKIITLPATPAIWTLKLLEKAKLSPLYAWVYETATTDSFVSIEKAQRQLGWQPQFSNQDALIENFRWYIDHREEFRRQSGISHRSPWQQGALRLLKHLF